MSTAKAPITTDDLPGMEFSGKIGGSVAANDKVSVYAELAGITGDLNNSYGGKLGAKYNF